MKPAYLILSLAITTITISSCKKDKKDEVTPTNPTTTYSDFSKLKVGNYWIYQRFTVDSSGNATPQSTIDSCFVEKDTTINGYKYFKVFRPGIVTVVPSYSFLRDSLHYLVNSNGDILFSSQDFTSIFSEQFIMAGINDTLCKVVKQMDNQYVSVVVPAGTYNTLNSKETYNMYPNWSHHGSTRHINVRYAKDIGIISETLSFFTSVPTYTERRLLRYHLN